MLGAGSYGAVYLARADKNGQTVAIKIAHVHDDARRIERFRRETSLCSRLRHPSIVQLLDDGVCGQYVYGVFEYVPGVTLKQRLLQEGPLDLLENRPADEPGAGCAGLRPPTGHCSPRPQARKRFSPTMNNP